MKTHPYRSCLGILFLVLSACGTGTSPDLESTRAAYGLPPDTAHYAMGRPSQGHGRRCSPEVCAEHAKEIGALCAELYPSDGKIWFEYDGAPCWCPCEEFTTRSLAWMDSARDAKEEADVRRYAERVGHMAKGREAHRPPKGRRSKSHLSEPDTLDAAADSLAWSTISAAIRPARWYPFQGSVVSLKWIINQCLARYPIFKVTYDTYPDWPYPVIMVDDHLAAAATWSPSDGPLPADERITIDLPSIFLDHPRCKGELIFFMITHEIGHALGTPTSCNPVWDFVCEGDADYWAAMVGLRSVFSGPRFVDISIAAEKQLGRYASAPDVDTAPECGYCMATCDEHACGHPPRACRMNTIAAGRALLRRPTCIDTWLRDRDAACRALDPCP